MTDMSPFNLGAGKCVLKKKKGIFAGRREAAKGLNKAGGGRYI